MSTAMTAKVVRVVRDEMQRRVESWTLLRERIVKDRKE